MKPAFTLFVAIILYRIAAAYGGVEHPWLLNFSPVAAIALCGPLVFPRQVATALPLAALLASDILLNVHYGASLITGEMLARYVALVLVSLLGLRLRECRQMGKFLLASAAGSTAFFFITNSVSWLTAPEYAKTMGGWVQALTIGVPGYPPTWFFFRNAIVSDAFFSLAIFGCLALSTNKWIVSREVLTTRESWMMAHAK